MSGELTYGRALERLNDYLAAEEGITLAQEYTLANGQKLTKANLSQIQSGIKYWREICSELKSEESSGIGFYQAVVK